MSGTVVNVSTISEAEYTNSEPTIVLNKKVEIVNK